MKANLFRNWLLLLMMLIGLGSASAQTYSYSVGDKVTTDDGVFVVKGSNLIANPTFDEGTANWVDGTGASLSDTYFEVLTTGGADGGACLKALSSAGSGKAASICTGWAVTPGKTYVLMFWAYRNALDGNAKYSQIHLGATATNANHQIGSVNYTAGAWSQTELVFESDTYNYVIARLGWLGNGTSFDCFNLYEVEASDELVLSRLEEEIAAAQSLLESTEEGTGKGQYTTEVRQALQDAISTAQGVLGSATTQTEINDAITALKEAESTYSNSVNPPFTLGVKYNIVHSSGYYLSSGGEGGTVKIVESDVNDNSQIFTFQLAPEGAAASGYNMVDADGVYIFRQGSWDTKSSASQDITVANAIFQVVDYDDYVQLKNMGSNSVLGTDANSVNSTVYSNKNGTDGKYRWTLVEYVPEDERDAEYNYNELLGKAQKEYSAINTANVGNRLFQYNKSAYDAYGEAIAASQQMTDYAAALEYLKAAMETFAANAMNNPDPNADYIIKQSSGQALGYSESEALGLLTETAEPFNLIASSTTGAYYIKHKTSGKYLAKDASSNWNTSWEEAEGNATAQWVIAPYDDTYYTLQNQSGKGYLGSDATVAGSLLYCDKAASLVNSHWTIVENSVSGIVDATLQTAKDLLAETEVGSEYWQVPQSAADALQTAISKAESDKQTATTETADAIVEALQAAMETFRNSFNPLPVYESDLIYYAVHYGGNVLTATASGNATITAPGDDGKPTELQRLYLESSNGGNSYYIKSVASGTYLSVSGTYDTQWLSTPDASSVFQIVRLSGKYLGLYNVSKSTYFGTDGTTDGQMVYSDKAGVQNSYWLIQPYQDLDRTLFNAALEKVQTYADSMVEGYEVGEYFADVIAEYAELIATAQSNSKRATSQEELDQMAAELEATIAEYQALANSTNRAEEYLANMIEEAKAEAAAVTIGVEKGQYTQSVVDAYNDAITAAEKATDAEAAIEALEQAAETFRNGANSVDRAVLNSQIATGQKATAAAVAGDCNGQYPQSAIDAYNSAIAAAQEVYNDVTKTQEEVDAAAQTLKQAAEDFADQRVVIDFSVLSADITAAQKLANDNASLIGEGPGTYPQSAYDALQEAIATARTYLNNNSVNQEAVDNAVDALQEAIGTFEESWRDIDRSELEALLQSFYSLLNETGIDWSDEDMDILTYDIQVGEDAMKSGEQAVIDRAIKILTRDYELLAGIATAIERITSGESVAEARIYDLNGRRLARAQRGLNIVRLNGKSYKVLVK